MRKVWISPCPGVAMPGMLVCRRFGFCRFVYRGFDGRCRRITLFFPGANEVIDR